MEILCVTIPGQQPRWYKGVTSVLFTHVLLYMTCGLLTEDEFVRLVDWYILHYQESFQATQAISVVKKLEVAISNECANEERREKVRTWLNTTVKVNQNGRLVEGLAIKSSKLVEWPNIGRKEVVEEAAKHGQNVINISVPFAPTMANDSRNKKAVKFPKSLFSESMLQLVDNPIEETDLSAAQSTEETDTGCRLDEAQLSILKRVYSALICDVPILRMNEHQACDSDGEDLQPTDELELTPKSRRVVDSFTPKRKRIFEMGYLAGAKRRLSDTDKPADQSEKGETSDRSTSSTNVKTGTGVPEEESATPVNGGEDDSGKALQVTSSQSGGKKEGKSVSGTIGVMKRSAVVDPDSCRLCSLTSPPGLTRGKGKKGKCVDWVQCDGCDGWFHQICSGLSSVPEKWFCKDCEQSECSPTVD